RLTSAAVGALQFAHRPGPPTFPPVLADGVAYPNPVVLPAEQLHDGRSNGARPTHVQLSHHILHRESFELRESRIRMGPFEWPRKGPSGDGVEVHGRAGG